MQRPCPIESRTKEIGTVIASASDKDSCFCRGPRSIAAKFKESKEKPPPILCSVIV